MSIRKHPRNEGLYIVDYYPDGRKGKRIREPVKGMENALKSQKYATVSVVYPPQKDIVDEYLLSVKLDIAATTYAREKYGCINHIILALGN